MRTDPIPWPATFHAGESLRGENDEIAIALRCGVDRLGHGFNLYRYPELEKAVMEKGIPMEICPVSNAALGYCRDFAQHPARQYMESGIPIIICSDDAAYQARSVLTGDYLAVAVGWDLSLAQIRQLCRISIENSFLVPARKQVLRNWFKGAWKQFAEEKFK